MVEIFKYFALLLFLLLALRADIRQKPLTGLLLCVFLTAGVVWGLAMFGTVGLIDASAGLFLGGGSLYLVSAMTKGGASKSDAKVFAVTGAFLGSQLTLSALMVSTLLCAITGAVLILAGKYSRKGTILFTPFIMLGSAIGIFLQPV